MRIDDLKILLTYLEVEARSNDRDNFVSKIEGVVAAFLRSHPEFLVPFRLIAECIITPKVEQKKQSNRNKAIAHLPAAPDEKFSQFSLFNEL